MAGVEYQKAGVCKLVTDTTVDTSGLWLRATDVGNLDELMNDASFFKYIVSATGAVLEPAVDGLRVSSLAAGAGLAGGGSSKLKVSIGKQTQQGITDTDKIMFEDAGGALWWTTRQDVTTSGPIKAYSVMGNATAGSATQKALGYADIPLAGSLTNSHAIGFDAGGTLKQFSLTGLVSSVTMTPVYSTANVSVLNSAGPTWLINPVTDSTAGVMTPAMKSQLDSISAGSTNLSVTRTATSVTIVNSSGTDATIPYATSTLAGVLTSVERNYIGLLATAPQDTIFTSLAGTPTWEGMTSFTPRPWLSSARLLGWDANGDLGIFSPVTTPGGGSVSNVIHLTAHSLTAGNIGMPITSSGTVWDDTDTDSWPLGILLSVVDNDTVEVTLPGQEMTIPASIMPAGFNPAVSGGWMAWDYSASSWVTTIPTDSVADMCEMIQVTEGDGLGDWYAIVHDFGPLGASSLTGGSGSPPAGTEEILLSAGVPGGSPAAGFKLAVDTVNNDFYRANGASWTLISDGIIAAADGATSIPVTNAHTVTLNYTLSAGITAFTGANQGQTILLVSENENATVTASATIRLAHGDDWDPGTSGGTLQLRYVGTKWEEISRTSYTAQTNIIAG